MLDRRSAMFLDRCKHHWEETRRYAHPPASDFKFGGGLWGEEAKDGLYGWTMVELRCRRCGDVKTKKISYAGGVENGGE